MEQSTPIAPLLAGTVLAFQLVPHQRRRADGWTSTTQQRVIDAREAMGSVGRAALHEDAAPLRATKASF